MKVGVERKDANGKPVLEMVPLRRPIKIEDLLLHTSGITYGFIGEGLVKQAYEDIYLGDFDNAGFAERISKMPLAEQPRTLWDYGHSIDVLGRVIEVASGQSLYQFEKQNLFEPLGMTTTKFFLTDPAERARYAQPLKEDRHDERNSLDVTRWESGGGGLVSTIADFARYGQMLLNGGTLDANFVSKSPCRDDEGPYRPGLRGGAQLFLFPWRRLWLRLRFRRTHRSRQRGAAAARLARRDQVGRRHRLLSRGRPGAGHVFPADGESTLGTHARTGECQEDDLRRIREVNGEAMLRAIDEGGRTQVAAGRIVALDRARTFIILLVLLHHSVVNYSWFGAGDKARWLGFDLVVLFNNCFFMAFMFLISGLFVHDSGRKGPATFLRDRAWRLGIPFLMSVFVLMPIAYYPTFLRYHLPGTTDFNFLHFWWRTLTGRAVAVGTGMVPVGAAGAGCVCRRDLGDGAAGLRHRRARIGTCATGR